MSLFHNTQMAEKPNCFVIESDEDSDTESALSSENNVTRYKYYYFSENLSESVDPLSINDGTMATYNFHTSSEDAVGNGLSLAAPIQESNEISPDEFEFDFQSIDEAEKSEHILKVRVHANFCMRCGAGFVQQKKLNIHLRKNKCSTNTFTSETSLTCSICGRGFVRRNCLRHHFMLHAQTKPFKCKECSCSFVTQRDLYSHYRTHDDCRPFICNICPETYKSIKHLVAHRRQDHASKRPYFCRLCPKRFNQLKNLIAHRKKHSLKKPFKCKFCKHRYSHKSVRNMHMRTHTLYKSGKLSFLCEICGMTHASSRFETWLNPFPDLKRTGSEDSIVCIGDSDSNTSKKNHREPNTIVRRRLPSASSDSIEIIEDPLQFTIDLVDD